MLFLSHTATVCTGQTHSNTPRWANMPLKLPGSELHPQHTQQLHPGASLVQLLVLLTIGKCFWRHPGLCSGKSPLTPLVTSCPHFLPKQWWQLLLLLSLISTKESLSRPSPASTSSMHRLGVSQQVLSLKEPKNPAVVGLVSFTGLGNTRRDSAETRGNLL